MDKTSLVEKDIEEAKRLIKALDESQFEVKAALWFYLIDSDEWRLLIASPFVEENGPKRAYNFIQRELARMSPSSKISLKEISVLSPQDDIRFKSTRRLDKSFTKSNSYRTRNIRY